MRNALVILLLWFGSAAFAQNDPPFTFDRALQTAFENNPSIQASAHQLRAADRERQAAIGLHMPQINLTGSYARLDEIKINLNNLKRPTSELLNGIGGLLPVESQSIIGTLTRPLLTADWQLRLQEKEFGFLEADVVVPIWMGGRIRAANRVARIGVEQARLSDRAVREKLTSEVAERYFGLLVAYDAVELAQEAVSGVEAHLNEALALEKNGLLAHAELLYVEYRLSEARGRVKEAELRLATLRSALENSLGEPITEIPSTPLFMVHDLEPLAYFLALGESENAQLQAVSLKSKLAHEGVRVLRSGFLPEVAAAAGGTLYEYRVSDLVPRWAVGIGFRWRLFDGLNREYKYAAARATEERVRELESEAASEVGLLIESLYNELCYEADRFRTFNASIRFAEEWLRSRRIAFREGMSTSTEVLDAELELKRVRTERLECAYRFDRALARLMEAAGQSEYFGEYIRRGEAVTKNYSIEKE